MRSSKYTREVLAPIVASSRSISEVTRRLGLIPNGGNHRMISSRIRRAELDTTHFTYRRGKLRVATIPRETLLSLVPDCTSVAMVLAKLDLPTEGRPHRDLTKRLRDLAIDTKHFRGMGWSRGESARTHPSIARTTTRNSFSDDEVFVANSPIIEGRSIRRRLLAMGWPYRCAWCDLVEWRGQPLVLHLDHINGIHNDNRLVNLRWLCPNCHSQTDTYCNRRR